MLRPRTLAIRTGRNELIDISAAQMTGRTRKRYRWCQGWRRGRMRIDHRRRPAGATGNAGSRAPPLVSFGVPFSPRIATSILACAALAAGPLTAQQHPITWSLTGNVKGLRQGKPFPVMVRAQIPPSWHLYSTTQPPGGPVQTVITIPDHAAFTLAGAPRAREPDVAPDNNFEIVTETYADSVTFITTVVPLMAGAHTLRVKVSYQTCTNRYCLPPTDEELELPVQIAPGSVAAAVPPAPPPATTPITIAPPPVPIAAP